MSILLLTFGMFSVNKRNLRMARFQEEKAESKRIANAKARYVNGSEKTKYQILTERIEAKEKRREEKKKKMEARKKMGEEKLRKWKEGKNQNPKRNQERNQMKFTEEVEGLRKKKIGGV